MQNLKQQDAVSNHLWYGKFRKQKEISQIGISINTTVLQQSHALFQGQKRNFNSENKMSLLNLVLVCGIAPHHLLNSQRPIL